ncbi:MAG TPA: hypothetical protein VF474_16460 [Phenylobacterium sp.]
MRDWKVGDVLEVMDDRPKRPGGRKPPFRKGQMVVIQNLHPEAGVGLQRHGGYWDFKRFEVRRG